MQRLAERPNRVNGGLLDAPRSVDELFHRFWGGLPLATAHLRDTWRPPVDILETPQAYFIRADVPGIDPEQIEVTMVGDTLTIRGEKLVEDKIEDQTWAMSERQGGRFERSFTLPAPVAADSIEAEAKHGVLTVKLTKAKEAQPKRISIRTS